MRDPKRDHLCVMNSRVRCRCCFSARARLRASGEPTRSGEGRLASLELEASGRTVGLIVLPFSRLGSRGAVRRDSIMGDAILGRSATTMRDGDDGKEDAGNDHCRARV